ncbi:MAG: ATP-grasp domain-containing protein [Lachnospiraceae bacterium]|nr:ATP-grasp domain-containing protein [Lachnospiraceae bacterium]
MKVAIVYGGTSSEREASAENAKYIGASLEQLGYEICMVPYEKNLVQTLKNENTDMVYVCVQGKGHGDGTIQAILQQEGIPYTGSDAHAAAVINDKIISKMLFEKVGLQTPEWMMLTREDYEKGVFDPEAFGYPFVAKAPSEGGSFGIALIRSKEEMERIEEVFAYESPILIERFIPGDFYTIGILQRDGKDCVLPCVQGVELHGEKENDDPDSLKVFTGEYGVKEAKLPKELLEQMAQMARGAFSVTGARDVARIDFMVDCKDNQPYILEINAVPGLKPRSLLPGAARMAGITYNDLIEGVLLAAKERTKAEEIQ